MLFMIVFLPRAAPCIWTAAPSLTTATSWRHAASRCWVILQIFVLFYFIFKYVRIHCVHSGEQIFPEPAWPPGGHFRQLLTKPNRGLGKGKASVKYRQQTLKFRMLFGEKNSDLLQAVLSYYQFSSTINLFSIFYMPWIFGQIGLFCPTRSEPGPNQTHHQRHRDRRPSTTACPGWWAKGTNKVKIVQWGKLYFVLGWLKQPKKDKSLLYRHEKHNDPTKEGPLSYVLQESPCASVSTVGRAHPSLVSLPATLLL